MSDFIHKLFTSYKARTDGNTRVGELYRIWYDSITNTLRIQLDDTPGGTVIGGGAGGNYTLPTASATVKGGVKVDGTTITITNQVISATQPDLSGYATLTGEETLTNKTLTSPTITDGVFQHTFSIGNQIFYEHGYNGFSVNEDFDIVGEGNFTGYHYTSGAGRDGVAFTLARTGQFTTGFGIHGTSSANEYVIGSETANTDFVFKSSIGMPFDVSGGNDIFRIGSDGSLTLSSTGLIRTTGDFKLQQGVPIDVNPPGYSSGSWDVNQGTNIATTGGSGTGLTVDIVGDVSGYTSSIAIHTPGSGYLDGETVTASNGGSDVTFSIVVRAVDWKLGATGGLTFPNNTTQTTAWTGTTDQALWVNPSPEPGTLFRAAVTANSDGVSIDLTTGIPGYGSMATWLFTNDGVLTFPNDTIQDTAWTGSVAYADVTDTPTLATVATSGSYTDLSNKPTLFSGSYTDLTSKPTIYTSAYIGTTSLAFNRSSASQTLNGVSIDGNAATATSAATLTTARNINGVSFNGSANINVDNITNGTNTMKIVAAPSTLAGASGDVKGNVAFDDTYVYYCKTSYGGSSYTVIASSGTTATYVQVRKGAYPTPQAGWTITFGTPLTISSVVDAGVVFGYDSWTLNLSTSVTSTGGSSYTLTDTSNTIWVRTPWNAITASGNAATATKLATARAINGVNFDGSAALTVTAAAGTLSGDTLASGVTASSLTSVGTLTSLSSGAITTTGTLAVNASGGLTTNQTTFPLVNTTASTINFAGAATTLNIGASTGTTTVNNNLRVTGNINTGTNSFAKSPGAGDIVMDNNSTDTPGLLMYYAANSNFGIDSWNGTFDILSGQLFRVTNKLNETGGSVKMAIDTSGNAVFTGFVQANAWRAGQVIKETVLGHTDVTQTQQGGVNRFATDSYNREFIRYAYTPSSSSSYIVVTMTLAKYSAYSGTGNDSWFSQMQVGATSGYSRNANGEPQGLTEVAYSLISTVNGNRTGTLFPLMGRYTNGDTNSKTISIAVRRESADDYWDYDWSASSFCMRITEIAR